MMTVGAAMTVMNVEVVGMGQCNLRCPSCPVGNQRDVRNPMGFMPPSLLEAIVRKAVGETAIRNFALFNWGEPTLHPKIVELIHAVHAGGGRCKLSSNLNFAADFDAIIAANPFEFRISASGFNQSSYGVTHRGGDIEIVKRHMRLLADAKKRHGSTTNIHVLYHRYKNNLDDEAQMRAYCDELGFELQPVWAYLMGYEKVLAFAEGGAHAPGLSDEDRSVIDRMGLPLAEALAASKQHAANDCYLRENQLTLDYKGDVVLCCSVYDVDGHVIAPYLQTSLADIQGRKSAHPTCGPCMENGLHVYNVYGAPEMERLAAQRTLVSYAERLGFMAQQRQPAPL